VKIVLVWFLLIFVLKLPTSGRNRGLRPASGYPLMMMMMMMKEPGGESARGRTSQGMNKPGGKSARGRTSQGANEKGGERAGGEQARGQTGKRAKKPDTHGQHHILCDIGPRYYVQKESICAVLFGSTTHG